MQRCAVLVLVVATSCCTGARLTQDDVSSPRGLLRLHASPPEDDHVAVDRSLPSLDHVVSKRQSDDTCECVDYYLCVNNTIDVTGGLALGPRLGEPCADVLQVCCRFPPGFKLPTATPATQREGEQGCGVQHIDFNAVDGVYSRIHNVDDREAYFGEFPWMLALLTGGKFVCGASLIHPRVALTAAHCINSTIENKLTIRAGEWDPSSENEPEPYQEVVVTRVIQHPDFYRHGLYHDVALLELEKPLLEGRNVGLICIASSAAEYNASTCLASGWGTDELGMKSEPFKTALRSVELPLVEHKECQDKLRKTRLSKFFTLHESFLCSGGKPGKDTCKGDGGGPLVCALKNSPTPRYVQVGIVSWGVGCGETDVPAVYADVVPHSDFISQQLTSMGYQLGSYTT